MVASLLPHNNDVQHFGCVANGITTIPSAHTVSCHTLATGLQDPSLSFASISCLRLHTWVDDDAVTLHWNSLSCLEDVPENCSCYSLREKKGN